MKYLVMVITIALSSWGTARAQETEETNKSSKHYIGATLGLSLTNITASEHFNSNFKVGFNGGLIYAYQFHKNFFFSTGLEFQQRGFLMQYIETDKDGFPIGSFLEVHGYKYINTPLKLGMKSNGPVYVLGQIGLVPAFMVEAMKGTSKLNDPPQVSVSANPIVFDLAAVTELGVGFNIKDKYHIYALLGYQQSFFTNRSNYDTQNTVGGQRVYHNGVYSTVGFKYTM
jgi:hypothetical protein